MDMGLIFITISFPFLSDTVMQKAFKSSILKMRQPNILERQLGCSGGGAVLAEWTVGNDLVDTGPKITKSSSNNRYGECPGRRQSGHEQRAW